MHRGTIFPIDCHKDRVKPYLRTRFRPFVVPGSEAFSVGNEYCTAVVRGGLTFNFKQSIATAVHLASVKRKLNFRKQYLSIQFRDREDDDNNPAKE